MKGIKGASARELNRVSGRIGRVWQDESWDRIVRDVREFEEAVRYIVENPVQAGTSCAGTPIAAASTRSCSCGDT
jgi:hypothetical protein